MEREEHKKTYISKAYSRFGSGIGQIQGNMEAKLQKILCTRVLCTKVMNWVSILELSMQLLIAFDQRNEIIRGKISAH